MKNKPTWYVLLTIFFCIISSFIAIILTAITLDPFATLADDGIEYLPSWSVFVIIFAVFITIKLVTKIAYKMFYYKPIFGKSIEEHCKKNFNETNDVYLVENDKNPQEKKHQNFFLGFINFIAFFILAYFVAYLSFSEVNQKVPLSIIVVIFCLSAFGAWIIQDIKQFEKTEPEYKRKPGEAAFTDISTTSDFQTKKKKQPQMPSYDYLLAIAKDEEDWRREQSGLKPIEYELKRINGMDGTMFENWCVNLLLRSGFQTAERTGKSGDQGVDIVAVKDSIRYAIQCKCYSSHLSNTPVQEVLGGKAMYNCHVGVVMTNSTFTKGAVELAQKHGILLWDQEHIRHMLEQEK